jgi:hypothetical protein
MPPELKKKKQDLHYICEIVVLDCSICKAMTYKRMHQWHDVKNIVKGISQGIVFSESVIFHSPRSPDYTGARAVVDVIGKIIRTCSGQEISDNAF